MLFCEENSIMNFLKQTNPNNQNKINYLTPHMIIKIGKHMRI